VHGLLTKLSGLDSSAERGLRVIEFFDQLVLHNADVEAVTRATAVLSEVIAGAILDDHGRICVVSSHGQVLPPAGPSSHALVNEIVVDDQTVGRVWLERAPDDVHEWDQLIIERMAIALATLRGRRQEVEPQLGLAHPATLHLLIRESTSESESARAARLLGFSVGAIVRVVAVQSLTHVAADLPALRNMVADTTQGRVVASAMSGQLAVIVAATSQIPTGTPPPGIAVCVGPSQPIEGCSGAWRAARKGVRFAALGGLWPRWTTAEDLGCVITLTDLAPEEVAATPDVQAIARLATGKIGPSNIKLLDTYGWLPSIREAATSLHMHHSSVNYRIEGLSAALGYDIRTPAGRYRARTALTLWQLHVSDRPGSSTGG
jgi:sugar diacid utilization regulator